MFLQLFACFCNLENGLVTKNGVLPTNRPTFWQMESPLSLAAQGVAGFAFPTFYQLAVYIRWIAAAACSEVLRPLT